MRIPRLLGNDADQAIGMKSAVKAEHNRAIVYWLTTAILAVELLVGGVWDVLMLPQIREVIHRVGYPFISLSLEGLEAPRLDCDNHPALSAIVKSGPIQAWSSTSRATRIKPYFRSPRCHHGGVSD